MHLRTIKIRNGDYLQNYRYYRCDRCSEEIEEPWPMTVSGNEHYCWNCSFHLNFIDGKAWLSCSGFGGMANVKAAIHEGEIQIWTTKKPPWEMPDSAFRRTKQYRVWRVSVFERDKGMCQHCGSSEGIQAHHIKPFSTHIKLRYKVSNGLTLCNSCHRAEHKRMKQGDRNVRRVSNQ